MIKTIITSNVFVWVLDGFYQQTLVRSLYTLLISVKLLMFLIDLIMGFEDAYSIFFDDVNVGVKSLKKHKA